MRDSNAAGTPRISLPICIAIYLSLATVSAIAHDWFRDRIEIDKREAIHATVLSGDAAAPSQYRIMVPLLTAGLQKLGPSFRVANAFVRFAFTALAAVLLHLWLRRWFRTEIAMVGTLLLFGYLPLTHLIYQMAWTDPANLSFTIMALMLIADRRDRWLAPLLAISMFNRETMLLVPLVWLLVRWDELPPLRCGAIFAGYCAAAFSVYMGLRAYYGPIPHSGAEFFEVRGVTPIEHNLTLVRGYVYALVWFSVPLWLAIRSWSSKPKSMRRALLFVPFFALFHLFVAVFLEPRLMLPIFPIVLAPALASIATPRAEPEREPQTANWLLRSPRLVYLSMLLIFCVLAHFAGYPLTHRELPFTTLAQ